MKKFIRDCFTVCNGQDWDLGRVLWFKAVVVFCCMAIYAIVWNKQPFNAVDVGTGLSLILAGGGAALGMKAKTEPDAK